jgi:hypothetical protein
MALKKLNLPKWSGELARPIDIRWSLLNPKPPEERWEEVLEARVAKLPALAKALGLPPRPRGAAREAWYAEIALELAVLVCPGFQEKPPPSKLTHPRNIRWLLAFIDKWKRDGGHVKFDLEECAEIPKLEPVKSDLEGCEEILKLEQPELARPHNTTKLRQRARTLANSISRERTSRKR